MVQVALVPSLAASLVVASLASSLVVASSSIVNPSLLSWWVRLSSQAGLLGWEGVKWGRWQWLVGRQDRHLTALLGRLI